MPSIPLDQCQANQTGTIIAMQGDLETKLHLVNLGFHTHSHVKLLLVRSDTFVLNVDGSRFALGKDLAHRILVKPLS